jgi:preprotein translocase subunit SecE
MAKNDKKLPDSYATKTPEKIKKDNRLFKWFREMRSELKKVIWPTRRETATNTVIALSMMLAAALLIWGFDTVAQAAVQTIIRFAG